MEKWEVEAIVEAMVHEYVCNMMNEVSDKLQTDLNIEGDMEITPYEYMCVCDALDVVADELAKIFTKRMGM